MRRKHWNLFITGAIILVFIVSYSSFAYAIGEGEKRAGYQPTRMLTDDQKILEDLAWLINIMAPLGEEAGSNISLTAVNFGVMPHDVDARAADLNQFLLLGAADETHGRITDIHTEIAEGSTHDAEASGEIQIGEKTKLTVSVKKHDREEKIFVVMQMHSTALEKLEVYQEWIRVLNERWSELGLQVDWRVNLQAYLKQDLHPDTLWNMLGDAGAIGAPGVEYEDGRSASQTYEVPALYSALVIDGREVNLQAAIHHLSSPDGHERYRITLGTPLITIEY